MPAIAMKQWMRYAQLATFASFSACLRLPNQRTSCAGLSGSSISSSGRRAVERVEEGDFLLAQEAGQTLDHAHAPVPAQDGVVVARRADLLRVGKALQRALEQRQQRMWRP